MFLKKALIIGGGAGGSLTLAFSNFHSTKTLVTTSSDSLGKVSGKDHKKVALLIRNTNKIQSNQQISQICNNAQSGNKHDLVGIGLLSEVNSNQFSSEGLVRNALVPIGCISQSGNGNNSSLGVVGNSSNFWYGLLDYENAIVELLIHGVDKSKTNSTEDSIIGWDGSEGAWKEKKEESLEAFDKCYQQKLPQIGDVLKKAFTNETVKKEEVKLNDENNCTNHKFRVSVMTVYQKGKSGWNFWDLKNGTSWGKFNKSFGDRLSNIWVGGEKIGKKDGEIFYGFPKKVSWDLKS